MVSGEVLLADDDAPIRKVLSRSLTRFGMTVAEVADGDDALELVRAAPGRFRLVVLDLTMPRLNGDEALLRIREIAPDLPALILSGFLEAEIRERIGNATRVSLLHKPFSMRSLAAPPWAAPGHRVVV